MSETNGDIRYHNENGQFAKGNPGKPKGAIVKVSVKVREAIVDFLENNIDQVQADFKSLKSPRERLQFISELLPYAAPKLSSVQVQSETNISGGITITWEEPKLPIGHSEGSNGKLQSISNGQENHS